MVEINVHIHDLNKAFMISDSKDNEGVLRSFGISSGFSMYAEVPFIGDARHHTKYTVIWRQLNCHGF